MSDTSGDDVRIRDVQDDDLPVFFEQQLDPEATRMAAFPSRERDVFMAHWAKIRADDKLIQQTVTAGGQVAGNVVSWEQDGRRLVGYWIGRPFWGRGIATKALSLLLGEVSSRPIYAEVAAHNGGSIRVLEKCGFRPVPAQDGPHVTVGEDGIEEVLLILEARPAGETPS